MNPFLLYMLKVASCLTLFYAFFGLVLRKETYFHLNRLYLVGSLLLAFILPAFPVASPFLTAPAVIGPRPMATALAAARSFDPADALFFIYAAGAAFCLIRLCAHLVHLAGVIRRSGIRRSGALRIVAVDRDFAPFSFLGLVFINARRLEEADLRRILAHEQVHVRQGHTFDVLLMELVVVLQWFNPFVWPYKKALRETHEYLADAGVIAQGFGPVGYRRLVFEQHVGAALFEFGNNFKQSQIKRRITMMSKNQSSGASRLKLLLAVPLVLGLVLAFAYPRAAAPSAPVLKLTSAETWQTSASPDKAELKAKAEKLLQEVMQLQDLDKKIGLKMEQASDDTTKKELALKRADVQKKLEHARQSLIATGFAPPPVNKADLKAQYMKLEEKAASVRAEMEKTEDPAKKAELKEILEKIAAKQEDIKRTASGAPPAKMTIDDLKKMSAELDAKKAQVQAEYEKTNDPAKKAELEATLEKIAAKQEDLKQLAANEGILVKKVSFDDLKKMSADLEAKSADIKAQLDKTEDASKKAELKELLHKIQQKQADVKFRIHEAESAKAGK